MQALRCCKLIGIGRVNIQNCFRACCSSPNHTPDAFGLKETEVGSYVQGLMLKPDGLNGMFTLAPALDDETSMAALNVKFQEYDEWVEAREEFLHRRKNEKKSDVDPELVHPAAFGSIRLDRDNVTKFHRIYDSHTTPNPDSPYLLSYTPTHPRPANEVGDQKSLNALSPARANTSIKVSAPDSPEDLKSPLATTHTTHDSNKVPRIYLMHAFNDLTRLDMWNLLRKTIIFQNEYLLAINKPFGLPIHSPSNESRHTFIDFIDEFSHYCKSESLYPLHRLDKDTTG